jgi:hypothetical protein
VLQPQGSAPVVPCECSLQGAVLAGHADAEARRSVPTALACATLVTVGQRTCRSLRVLPAGVGSVGRMGTPKSRSWSSHPTHTTHGRLSFERKSNRVRGAGGCNTVTQRHQARSLMWRPLLSSGAYTASIGRTPSRIWPSFPGPPLTHEPPPGECNTLAVELLMPAGGQPHTPNPKPQTPNSNH